ncbi:MAG: ferrous iron transport protein A [Cyanobacteria bacterium]|nr:ferrous iron transport protein A [Cyanobacteriota bacterium]MDA0866703.1 ferrous iron transport protein A [Cyanobacteriota bacterium]
MTFVGGAMGDNHIALTEGDISRSLARAVVGDHLTIRAIKGVQSTIQQLGRLGLQPGQMVTVLSCADSGSVIVACPKGNVGLGAAIARQVIVAPIVVTQPRTARPLTMASHRISPVS